MQGTACGEQHKHSVVKGMIEHSEYFMLVTKLYEYTLLFQAHAQLGFAMVDLVFHLS